jgi:hypothetical protein
VNHAETAALQTLRWAAVGGAAALPLLAVPRQDDPLTLVTLHLGILVAFGAALAYRLAPLVSDSWFTEWTSTMRRRAFAGVWIIVLATGAVGLVTIATSAALRYDPSLQFLQLLSALDIAWAAVAITVGLRRWKGKRAAIAAVTVLGVVCVWSIWRYLDVVGFGPNGSWIVDGGRLMTLVIPYDMAAAAVAVTLFVFGVRSDSS